MSNILNRNIKYLASQKGISQEKLGNYLNRNRGFISSNFQGKSHFEYSHLEKLSELFEVPIEILQTVNLVDKTIDEIHKMIANEPSTEYGKSIPIYNNRAAAGFLSKQDVDADEFFNYRAIGNFKDATGGVYIEGDSMEPFCRSGSLVLFKELNNTQEFRYNHPHLLVLKGHDEGFVFKYVMPADKAKHILLRSDNPNYPDQEIQANNVVKIFQYIMHINIRAEFKAKDQSKLVFLYEENHKLREELNALKSK